MCSDYYGGPQVTPKIVQVMQVQKTIMHVGLRLKTFMQVRLKTFMQVQKTFMQVQKTFKQLRLKTFMQVF